MFSWRRRGEELNFALIGSWFNCLDTSSKWKCMQDSLRMHVADVPPFKPIKSSLLAPQTPNKVFYSLSGITIIIFLVNAMQYCTKNILEHWKHWELKPPSVVLLTYVSFLAIPQRSLASDDWFSGESTMFETHGWDSSLIRLWIEMAIAN